jgi:hypothetical protein
MCRMEMPLDNSVVLRQELFPLSCQTPGCNRVFTVEDVPQILSTFGLVYAELGEGPFADELAQGLYCTKAGFARNPNKDMR